MNELIYELATSELAIVVYVNIINALLFKLCPGVIPFLGTQRKQAETVKQLFKVIDGVKKKNKKIEEKALQEGLTLAAAVMNSERLKREKYKKEVAFWEGGTKNEE